MKTKILCSKKFYYKSKLHEKGYFIKNKNHFFQEYQNNFIHA
jgi:hypothetical protein